MATITLTYNTRNLVAMSMIDAIRKSGAFKVEEKKIKSPYDPKFVEKIKRSAKSKGKEIKIKDLWK